jgi:ferrous iron transport protein B
MIHVAFAGQPNSGKSTIFNMLCGMKQHVANYPGVTVDKYSARIEHKDTPLTLVDLPGTYSFSMFSLEERVAKEYILDEEVDVLVNVVDASNLRRNLYLTFQLLELGKPTVMILNMMDVAQRRELDIDVGELARLLHIKVVPAVGVQQQGKEEILDAIVAAAREARNTDFRVNYAEFEPYIEEIEQLLPEDEPLSRRWLALKALEGDEVVLKRVGIAAEKIRSIHDEVHARFDLDIDQTFASIRYENADVAYHKCVREKHVRPPTLTDRIDRVVLNRWFSFPVLAGVIFLIYQFAIVWGYKITDYTWPMLAWGRQMVMEVMPAADFIQVPLLTEFALWMVNSTIALLNYIPVFFILFALIAILEDVGYMPRMAFILDRVFKRYGLHGQSTLPLVLGGAIVGGCAVPGVMATKGIADERARLATIMTVPYMNCLAKVPFYTLLLGAFFAAQMSEMMFYISTVTLFIALIMARFLTSTFLSQRETAPFIMELPPYHLPTVKGVLMRAGQRVWLYVKKVITIVLAVAVVLFLLLQYPGVPEFRMREINACAASAMQAFDKTAAQTDMYHLIDERHEVVRLLNLYASYREQRMRAGSREEVEALNASMREENPHLFTVLEARGSDARRLNMGLRKLQRSERELRSRIKQEKISSSYLGIFGRALEPLTRFSGFDWRVNVAFLSSFAARESAVATLGSIYEQGKADERAEQTLAADGAYTPIHAVAMLIFMIFSPPCIATMVVVKLQSNSYRWMLFATFFPIGAGIAISALFFTLAGTLGWSGIAMMRIFYVSIVTTALLLAMIKPRRPRWEVGE